MGSEKQSGHMFGELSDTHQLLNPEAGICGVDIFRPYSIVSEQEGSFRGKQGVITEVVNLLNSSGAAALEGGYRSGKTSLLITIGERIKQQGGGKSSFLLYDFQTHPNKNPDEVEEYIEGWLKSQNQIDTQESGAVIIAFDEFGEYEPSYHAGLLEKIGQLKDRGYLIVFSVIGDLNGNSPAELARPIKDKILEITGQGAVINRLLDDEEVAELLRSGNENIFSEEMHTYLIRESGGHPYLAQLMAGNALELIVDEDIEPGQFLSELENQVITKLDNFDRVIDIIVAAGFNPLTWEWTGEGDQINADVYKNMIPRPSSQIFQKWLKENLDRRFRKQRG